MIKVCDALCGAGKTTACINMMNTVNDFHYIFVTQYLTEVNRIIKSCDKRKFVTPVSHNSLDIGGTKLEDVHKLLAAKENISTTHALFTSFTDETKRLIQEGKYILVLDEVIDVCSETNIAPADIEIMSNVKLLEKNEDSDILEWKFDDYSEKDGLFTDVSRRAKSHNLMEFQNTCLFWTIPPELFTVFTDVYILTYMFEYQSLCYFLKIHDIKYKHIGVRNYRFFKCDTTRDTTYKKYRVRDLRDKVHILESDNINDIGNGRTNLSYTWYKKELRKNNSSGSKIKSLRKVLYNVVRNLFKVNGSAFMWTTFKEVKPVLEGKGYIQSFVTYNKRASNEYSKKKYLAYLVNVFCRPWEVAYYRSKSNGTIEVDQDMYALSSMVQWLFRSAIRNNEEVWIYIPSARMRYLLKEWLNNLAVGDDLKPIKYTSSFVKKVNDEKKKKMENKQPVKKGRFSRLNSNLLGKESR